MFLRNILSQSLGQNDIDIFTDLGKPLFQLPQTLRLLLGSLQAPVLIKSPSERPDYNARAKPISIKVLLTSLNCNHAELRSSILCLVKSGNWQSVWQEVSLHVLMGTQYVGAISTCIGQSTTLLPTYYTIFCPRPVGP
jgi:hypothetical protein